MTPEDLQTATELQKQIRKTQKAKDNLATVETQVNGQRAFISVRGKSAQVIASDLVEFLQSQQDKAQNRLNNLQTQFDEL